jgi:hypothetical protein
MFRRNNIMTRYVVCAALRLRSNPARIICGPRHFDLTMHQQIRASVDRAEWKTAEQGFIDQKGVFLTREEARVIAEAAGQIRQEVTDNRTRLDSSNLY